MSRPTIVTPHRRITVLDEAALDHTKDYLRAGLDPRHLIEYGTGNNYVREDGDAWEHPQYAFVSHGNTWLGGPRWAPGTYVHPEPETR